MPLNSVAHSAWSIMRRSKRLRCRSQCTEHTARSSRKERNNTHFEQGSRSFRVASPEDMVLMLLEFYKGDGKRPRRLWETILEILTAQGVLLDLAYLRLWATVLDVAPLLEQALITAGLSKA